MSFFSKIKEMIGRMPTPRLVSASVTTPKPVSASRVDLPTVFGVRELQRFLGVKDDGDFGPTSKEALLKRFSNFNAPAMTEDEIRQMANRLGVSSAVIKAVKAVEAPRGAFDKDARPTILYEKHIFGKLTGYKYNQSYPDLSSSKWMPGTYGPASNQWNRLANACALNPKAAFESASFGAFQILGTNAVEMGYKSAFHMALELTKSELAHLESFERFVRVNGLLDELRQCRAGSASSCVPFVQKYNGPAFARNNYHIKFASAIARYD